MIQWHRVRQLRDEVGADEFDEVVQIFLDEVQEVIARLHQDTARTQLEQNLHFLKGSALKFWVRPVLETLPGWRASRRRRSRRRS